MKVLPYTGEFEEKPLARDLIVAGLLGVGQLLPSRQLNTAVSFFYRPAYWKAIDRVFGFLF